MIDDRPKVLVVDDELGNRNLMTATLDDDFRVVAAAGGDDALGLLTPDVAVVLCDERMPGMSGMQVLCACRERVPTASRVLATAYPDVRLLAEAINAGNVRRYLGKPFAPETLRALVRQEAEYVALVRADARRAELLEQTTRELETVNFSMAHDLKTHLRTIEGFTAILLEDYSEGLGEDGIDLLRRVRRAGHRLAELSADLVSLAEATRRPLIWSEASLSDMVRDAVLGLREAAVASGKNSDVELVCPPDLSVRCDPLLLRAAVVNLIDNAWKYTRDVAHPRIEVGQTTLEGRPAWFVRDNGPGFDPAVASRLFEPFVRMHPGGASEGAGLGLSIVARVVERHGGRVQGDRAQGGGAIFRFTLGDDAAEGTDA